VVPVALAAEVIRLASKHHEWEAFSKQRLTEGGDLRRYYPLADEARPEYEAWVRAQAGKH
jgi:regulator of RNase E activity RraA